MKYIMIEQEIDGKVHTMWTTDEFLERWKKMQIEIFADAVKRFLAPQKFDPELHCPPKKGILKPD